MVERLILFCSERDGRWVYVVPQEIPHSLNQFTTMKVNLKISAASRVIATPGCPKDSEYRCGIMYRMN